MLFILLFIRLPSPSPFGHAQIFTSICLYGPEKIHFEGRNVQQSVTLVMCTLAKVKKQ